MVSSRIELDFFSFFFGQSCGARCDTEDNNDGDKDDCGLCMEGVRFRVGGG